MANCTHPVVVALGSVTAYDTAPVAADALAMKKNDNKVIDTLQQFGYAL